MNATTFNSNPIVEVTPQLIAQASDSFSAACSRLSSVVGSRANNKGTELYDYQVEFAYLMREITDGPIYIAPKYLTKIDELVLSMYSKAREIVAERRNK